VAAVGLGAAALAERRHLETIARDPDFRRLSEPLGGRPVGPVASADGTQLHVEEFLPTDGPADVTFVLAHGWTERLSFWGPVIRRLTAAGMRVVAYDLRGHGDSAEASSGDYGFDRFGEDLEAVLAHAGSDPQRTVVAGHSLGAMSIAAWAADFDVAARVAAVAMVNTGLDNLIGGALIFGGIGGALNQPWVSNLLMGSRRPMLPVSTPLSEKIARYIAFGPEASDGTVAFYERMLLDTPPVVRGTIGLAFSAMDLSAAVPRITVPALVIGGDRDRLTPPDHARRIAAALPRGAGLLILERTGHMSPLERPDEVAEALQGLATGAGLTPTGSRPAPAATGS
jgi:pimeloyl-ACP methyl ester carboxylesterase